MTLQQYRQKRNFGKTSEPRGARTAKSHTKLAYVIQKHDASHLHYDFRLELDGVLKSWAVPKGPDLDPAVKRLAMQVEDHPLEYGGFEGTIPEGEYGGGTVLLWDHGTWEPIGDPVKGLREGHLKFILHGEKLKGAWMIVRKGGRRAEPGERAWFLFKERDDFARPGESVTEEMPLSVTTGRDLDEIAALSDRVWGPKGEIENNARKAAPKSATATLKKRSAKTADRRTKTTARQTAVAKARAKKRASGNTEHRALEALLKDSGARRARMPAHQEVELATLADSAPSGDDWIHEIKFDGYRMLCRLEKRKARFISRNEHDWTAKFPELAKAAAGLALDAAILDGEVVALNSDGTTSFQALQNVFQAGRTGELVYYAFDILHLNGYGLTAVSLELRREILKLAIAGCDPSIRFSDAIQGSGKEVMEQACRLHLEGIICKRRGSAYKAGRGVDWLKVKCSQRAEFVIGGFTKPSGSRAHFGALLLGYHDRGKKLVYAGRVGTGFNQKTLGALHQKLASLEQARSPFSNLSGTTGEARDVTWVKPALVAEVQFSNWTDEGLLRHPSFQGLREDKPAAKVIHDVPLSPGEVKAIENGRPAAEPGKGHNGKPAQKKPSRDGAKASATADGEFAGVHLTHPDKVLYPDQGITKRDLAAYYTQVADWMLPHVVDRPLAIVRCPAGSGKACFFQKHPGEGASEQLRQVNIAKSGPPEFNMAIADLGGLISLVQIGVLEIHVWGSRADHLEKPDRLIFDLDPDPSVKWPQVIAAARDVRRALEDLGLTSFLKTTGGKGLHLVVPVQPRVEWDQAKAFCRAVADRVVRAAPDRFIATMSKAARKGKIFIDYLRNGRGATAVAPYSTRNKPGATVSAPISWDELSPGLHSEHFTTENLPARLARLKTDPWADLAKTRQSITAAMIKKLVE